ncbi:MAG: DUF2905 family protein [Hyphomicrobiales bacterium]
MIDSTTLGRLLLVLGLVLVAAGALLAFGPRVPWLGWIGRLPGDFSFGGASWRVVVPLGTSLVISVVLTLLLRLLGRR